MARTDFVAPIHGAEAIGYEPATPDDWTDPDPQDVQDALDDVQGALAGDFVRRDGTTPLTGDWDNTGRRIRNTGVAEVSDTEPATPVPGMFWLDTAATGTGGLGKLNYITTTVDLTLTSSHTLVYCDATSGPITITLPDASTNGGKLYSIIKIDLTTNTVTVDAGSFDAVLTIQDEAVPFSSDETAWRIPF